jgi:hemerythrin superfamily protein
MTAPPTTPSSLAQQDDASLGGRLSVLVRQRRDHVRLDQLLHELDTTAPADQDTALRRLYRLVFPHAFAEESVLWPVLRHSLPDGPRLTLQIEREHQEVNELVTRLERLDADDPARGATLARLATVLREDVRDEEDQLLPQLQAVASRRQLRVLGVAWEAVRRIAPTRAHPVVARRPPGNVLAALPLSVLDRLRDRVDGRLQRGSRPRTALRRVSARLADAAHAVERLPPLRSGEDPATSRR